MAQLCNLHLTPVVVVFPAGLRSANQSWACVCVYVCTPGIRPAVSCMRDSPCVFFSLQ